MKPVLLTLLKMANPPITNIETGYCTLRQQEARLTFHVYFCNLEQAHNFLSFPLHFSFVIVILIFFIPFSSSSIYRDQYLHLYTFCIFASTSRLITFYGFLRAGLAETDLQPTAHPHRPTSSPTDQTWKERSCCHLPSILFITTWFAKYSVKEEGGKYVDCICIRQTITIKINCFCFTAPCCQFTSVDSAGSVKIATTTRSERTDSNLFQQNVLGHNCSK